MQTFDIHKKYQTDGYVPLRTAHIASCLLNYFEGRTKFGRRNKQQALTVAKNLCQQIIDLTETRYEEIG